MHATQQQIYALTILRITTYSDTIRIHLGFSFIITRDKLTISCTLVDSVTKSNRPVSALTVFSHITMLKIQLFTHNNVKNTASLKIIFNNKKKRLFLFTAAGQVQHSKTSWIFQYYRSNFNQLVSSAHTWQLSNFSWLISWHVASQISTDY